MAKAKKNNLITYTFIFDEDEAEWLKGYLQNDLSGRETEYDSEMREFIFNTLKDAK